MAHPSSTNDANGHPSTNGQSTSNGHSAGKKPGITVFSGGTAANSLVTVFNRIVERKQAQLTYVIPISDNGGSSSELIRVIGGPSVGDIRSRLVRLIPTHENDESQERDTELSGLKAFFEHRLPSDKSEAKAEWHRFVEATHSMWEPISSPKRELIRSILNTLNLEIVKRARPPHSVFDFSKASIGNMFLTGARIFSGSLESAIYLLSVICSIPRSVSVLPAISSNFTHHISARLKDVDRTIITGQVNISHPSAPTSLPDDKFDRFEDANLPGSHPALRRKQISFDKNEELELKERIDCVWYINPYGHEILPQVNPKVIDTLKSSTTVIYSIGSLYTSIVPSLVLQKVGEAIAEPQVRHKILILNSKLDRETGPSTNPMTALDFVRAIAKACVQKTVQATEQEADDEPGKKSTKTTDRDLHKYVSHLLYLESKGAPRVDVHELETVGIKCVKVSGVPYGEGRTAMVRYDETALGRALEDIIDS